MTMTVVYSTVPSTSSPEVGHTGDVKYHLFLPLKDAHCLHTAISTYLYRSPSHSNPRFPPHVPCQPHHRTDVDHTDSSDSLTPPSTPCRPLRTRRRLRPQRPQRLWCRVLPPDCPAHRQHGLPVRLRLRLLRPEDPWHRLQLRLLPVQGVRLQLW